MSSAEASRKGIDLVFAAPAMIVAELAWRWAFAVGAIGVLLSYASILRDAISLSAADQNALISGDLFQMIAVASHVSAVAVPLFLRAAEGALPKIVLLWWLCISLGRPQVFRFILRLSNAPAPRNNPRYWLSLSLVNIVRIILLLVVMSAYLAASWAAQSVLGTDIEHLHVFAALLTFLAIFSAGAVLYLLANFVAALAPIFVAKGRPALDALADALRFSLDHRALLGGIAAANATLRTVVATVVTGISVLLLPLSRYLPAWIIVALGALLTVAYCIASDVLLLARTTAYALAVQSSGNAAEKGNAASTETALYSAPPDLRS